MTASLSPEDRERLARVLPPRVRIYVDALAPVVADLIAAAEERGDWHGHYGRGWKDGYQKGYQAGADAVRGRVEAAVNPWDETGLDRVRAALEGGAE